MKQLNIPSIFKSEADALRSAREKSNLVHGTSDIRAAGNEIEETVRDYFKRILPSRYYVTHGHLIDTNGNVSSQLDLIVADNFGLPSLMTTIDGTEYIPIDSVYAIGEIKSTYYRAKKYIAKFSSVIKHIRDNLYHEEIPNTIYGGIRDDTNMRDVFLGKSNRTLNYIYKFILFIDGGDFDFTDVSAHYCDTDKRYLPNASVILNKGVIVSAKFIDESMRLYDYPEEEQDEAVDWHFLPLPGTGEGSLEGNHLGFLYWTLLMHLENSYLEPPSLTNYLATMLTGRKSLSKSAKVASSRL